MSHLRIVWRLLLARGMKHFLTVVVIALGAGLMLAAMATAEATRTAMSAMARRFPLVVGGEIGAVPLVLGSFTRLQDLSAGVDSQIYHRLGEDPRVEQVLPLLCGHAVRGYPLLATSPAYLLPRKRFPLKTGRVFEEDAMEVVLGRHAARGLGASLGNFVEIEHHHAGAPRDPGRLKIVGILDETNSDADRTLFCPLSAIFHTHDMGTQPRQDENAGSKHKASSLLVRPQNDQALLSLQEELDAIPGVEVALTGQTLGRISDQLGTGGRLLGVLVSGLILIVFLSLLISVYGTSMAQAREVAVMRVLGAGRSRVLVIMLLVTVALAVAGALGSLVVGVLLGHAAESILRMQMGLIATVTLLSPSTLAALAAMVILLTAVGMQPAVAAYTVQAARALSALPGSGGSTRSYLHKIIRIAVPVLIVAWLYNATAMHAAEVDSPPLNEASAAIFQKMLNPHPEILRSLEGNKVTIEGYMYALGDPFEVQDFFLVSMDPRLPRCPFCYRSPGRTERILVRTGGKTLDLYKNLVRVTGVLHAEPEATDPYWMEMEDLEVVIP
jgi:putative ABC transport system permease protein